VLSEDLRPNGVGKTMILKNIALPALARGHTVRFTTASDMLAELAAQDSSSILARRFRRYTLPHLLCINEVDYLSYNSRYAVLLFKVVTRRYDAGKPIMLSTNKAFASAPIRLPPVDLLTERVLSLRALVDSPDVQSARTAFRGYFKNGTITMTPEPPRRSCEKDGINAIDYLTDVLMRVQTHAASKIDECCRTAGSRPAPRQCSIGPPKCGIFCGFMYLTSATSCGPHDARTAKELTRRRVPDGYNSTCP
jgi:hypothetical protein